jgi:hypothetical protein
MWPVARGVRRHGVEQSGDEALGQACKLFVAVILAEVLKDGAALGWRAASQTAPGVAGVVLGNGGTDGARLAARAGTDCCRRRGSERRLIGVHEFG